MTPINNSDTAWLIVSDYNQDNNLPYEDLREEIQNPHVNKWDFEYRIMHNNGGTLGGLVGGGYSGNRNERVGSTIENYNGGFVGTDEGATSGSLVGGHA